MSAALPQLRSVSLRLHWIDVHAMIAVERPHLGREEVSGRRSARLDLMTRVPRVGHVNCHALGRVHDPKHSDPARSTTCG